MGGQEGSVRGGARRRKRSLRDVRSRGKWERMKEVCEWVVCGDGRGRGSRRVKVRDGGKGVRP